MVIERIQNTIRAHDLADTNTPVLVMVSGGSDSTALAYIADELHRRGTIGDVAMLHVNHQLRGEDADADAAFVENLAAALDIAFFLVEVDVGHLAQTEGGNVEALARRERYAAAHDALQSLCRHAATPISDGRIFTAHTANDRVENFYMRSIVGTGPGGFRSMRYINGAIARPCLDVSRQDLRDYLARREMDAAADNSVALVRDQAGMLWREDATNAHTDQFRGFVRHNIVPLAKQRNPQLVDTLSRTMNLIADEDDMIETMVTDVLTSHVHWLACRPSSAVATVSSNTTAGATANSPKDTTDYSQGCVLSPAFGATPLPLQRRAAAQILKAILGPDARIETASIDAITNAFEDEKPLSGYTNNIQGNLALSANKRGLRIEPMEAYRARRKGGNKQETT